MPTLGILTPSEKAVARAAEAEGATINPHDLSSVVRVVLAVKPAKWREASQDFLDRLPKATVIISVMAGVSTQTLAETFGPRPVARVMPTTAVSAGAGVAAYLATDDASRTAVRVLFAPIATLVDLADDDRIDIATALSGSGAAYVYAFVRDLARAGERRGLTAGQAMTLARLTIAGALARLEAGGDADALIAEVASPGGTTEAGLSVLEPALDDLLDGTVGAALKRAGQLSS